jgi:hypothetical protein
MNGHHRGIPAAKMAEWRNRFAAYRHPPSLDNIIRWLAYFANIDIAVATKVLDNVMIVSELEIQQGYQAALQGIEGWNPVKRKRRGRWFFCGYGNHAHESGRAMLRTFSEANHLRRRDHNEMFVTPVDIPGLKLTSKDTLVFVDDFSGSGQQVTDNWPVMRELIASEARTFLVLSAITEQALQAINRDTDLTVIAAQELSAEKNVFDPLCQLLTQHEKNKLLNYCRIADRNSPRGYRDCGLLLVLSHRTPNNSLPILHVNKRRWRGLFPRYLLAEP